MINYNDRFTWKLAIYIYIYIYISFLMDSYIASTMTYPVWFMGKSCNAFLQMSAENKKKIYRLIKPLKWPVFYSKWYVLYVTKMFSVSKTLHRRCGLVMIWHKNVLWFQLRYPRLSNIEICHFCTRLKSMQYNRSLYAFSAWIKRCIWLLFLVLKKWPCYNSVYVCWMQ